MRAHVQRDVERHVVRAVASHHHQGRRLPAPGIGASVAEGPILTGLVAGQERRRGVGTAGLDSVLGVQIREHRRRTQSALQEIEHQFLAVLAALHHRGIAEVRQAIPRRLHHRLVNGGDRTDDVQRVAGLLHRDGQADLRGVHRDVDQRVRDRGRLVAVERDVRRAAAPDAVADDRVVVEHAACAGDDVGTTFHEAAFRRDRHHPLLSGLRGGLGRRGDFVAASGKHEAERERGDDSETTNEVADTHVAFLRLYYMNQHG